MTSAINVALNLAKKLIKSLRTNRIHQLAFIAASLVFIRFLPGNLISASMPRKKFFFTKDGAVEPYYFERDTIVIVQTNCESTVELLMFLRACAKLKKVTDFIGCKICVIVKQPRGVSSKDFWDTIQVTFNEQAKFFPTIQHQIRTLPILVDFKGHFSGKQFVNKSRYAVAMLRDKGRIVDVQPCSATLIQTAFDKEAIPFSLGLLRMLDTASGGKMAGIFLSEEKTTEETNIKRIVAAAMRPTEV